MAAPSLYRRYRPRTFSQVRGQDHVITAMRNAVRSGTEGHAYLFSGPRGTGKTSTARILAKALNCEDLRDGEPCCECDACVAMEAGTSLDLFELDAASNNKVDDMRSLVGGTVVSSPGRTKVYILDEVHMLSTGASNALLKTLEEPPSGVCFVLATTDPHKVLPTIRSRTQHFEFRLLSAAELEDYVRWIDADAGLDLTDEAVAHVVRAGRGSARDTLSALDQVVAAGGVDDREEPVALLVNALSSQDSGAAIHAVAEALSQGHDPRVLAESVLSAVRNAFLISVGVDVPLLIDAERTDATRWAGEFGTARLTRAMERIGSAMVDMRNAADPRVPLEVALISLTSGGDGSIESLEARVAALEAGGGGAAPAARPRAAAAAADDGPATAAAAVADASVAGDGSSSGGGRAAAARAALGSSSGRAPTPSAPAAAAPSDSSSAAAPAGPPTRPGRPPKRPAPPSAEPAADGRPAEDGRPAAPAAEDPQPAPTSSPEQPPAESPPDASAPVTAEPAPSQPVAAEPGAAEPVAAAAPPARPVPADPPAASAPASGGALTTELVAAALASLVETTLKAVAKAVYAEAVVDRIDGTTAVLAVPNDGYIQRGQKSADDVAGALSAELGTAVTIQLVVAGAAPSAAAARPAPASPAAGPSDGSASAAAPTEPVAADQADEDEDLTSIDVSELEDAPDVATTGVDRLTQAFPGAVLVDGGDTTT